MYLRCPWNVMCITQIAFLLIFLPSPPSTSNASVGLMAYIPSCRLFFMLLFSATCKHPCCLICLFCEEYIFNILPHFCSFSLKSVTCIGMLVTIFFQYHVLCLLSSLIDFLFRLIEYCLETFSSQRKFVLAELFRLAYLEMSLDCPYL